MWAYVPICFIAWFHGQLTLPSSNILSFITRKNFAKSKCKNFASSSLAGICNVIATNPLSVISNTVIAAHKSKHTNLSIISASKKIYRDSGLIGFYRGLTVSLILVSNPTINFTINSVLSKFLESNMIRKSKFRFGKFY